MLTLDAAATAAALPLDKLIDALRDLFARGCEVPPRQVLQVGTEAAPITSLVMPAWLPGQAYGVKVVNVAPSNREHGLPGVHASYSLFDGTTGAPLALLDGTTLTNRRTAAASALAASYLARPDASRLLLVGAGQIAALLPAAHRTQRAVEVVEVWARRPDQAEALARQLRSEGFDASAVVDLDAASGRAHIISCATLATTPLVHGSSLRAGTHLDLIGSFTPAMREADDTCFAGASLFIDTDEALAKSGELIEPMQRGVFKAEDVRARLAELCRGDHAGRSSAGERTVFKSVGNALEDLAAAMLAIRRN